MKLLKIVLGILGVAVLAFGASTLPKRVSNPDPASQTPLIATNQYQSEIAAIWPAPTDKDRVRARMVFQGETVVFQDGPVDLIMNTHSMRKSVISLLFGIAEHQGLVDLDKSLKALNIDEVIPLTNQEKTATIRDLLMNRSGVFLPAAGEHDAQITDRPKRDSHLPGTYFFGNNFDANALATIFEQETNFALGEFMDQYLGQPLGMQDFDAKNVVFGDPWFWPQKDSLHPQFIMYLSTRDFARIGAMVAQGGRWQGSQVVPADWIALSTSALSDLTTNHITYNIYDASGMMWWLDQDTQTVWTDGYGGQFMMIDPARNLTITERNFTGNSTLTTGLWMIQDGKFAHSRDGIPKTHAFLSKVIDQQ